MSCNIGNTNYRLKKYVRTINLWSIAPRCTLQSYSSHSHTHVDILSLYPIELHKYKYKGCHYISTQSLTA